jgi:uncharacterized membrane protein YgcG
MMMMMSTTTTTTATRTTGTFKTLRERSCSRVHATTTTTSSSHNQTSSRTKNSFSSDEDDDEKMIKKKQHFVEQLGRGVSAFALASAMSLSPISMVVDSANASEIEILQTPAPTSGYIVDDAGIMSRASAGSINKTLKELEDQTGYHLNVITVRKLVFEQDPYAFGDKVLETWYPTLEEGNNKGNFLLVKTAKEAAVVGGPKFLKAVGDDVLESVLSKNVPINLEYEKFNEALTSSVDRIAAVLEGKPDPGPPAKFEKDNSRTFKTKEETGAKREVFSNVVVGLLVISFVVPMLQYFGYVTGDPDFDD